MPTTGEPTTALPPTDDDPEPPTEVAATPSRSGDGGDGSSQSRRGVLILVALVLLGAAVGAFLLLQGDDDGDGGGTDTAAAATLSEQLQDLDSEVQFTPEDADCMANVMVERIGEERIAAIDIRDAPPEEDAEELNSAFNAALDECDVEPTNASDGDASTDDGPTGDDGNDGSTDATIDSPDDLQAFEDLYAEGFKTSYGLTDEEARCLAKKLTDAVRTGEVQENEAFGKFFDYLDQCGIARERIDPNAG
jgi:hypothetical protein